MGKPKLSISKMVIVDRNRRKSGTRGTTVHICRVFLVPDSLSLVWGNSVHFAKFTMLQFLKAPLLSQFSSISSKHYTRYHNHTGCHFLATCPKLQNYGTLKIFLTQEHSMQLEFSKCYFSHNFRWSPSKLYDNIGYHGKSKCLFEYFNEKLASRTWDCIFYFKLFKTFLGSGSSVPAERQGPWGPCLLSLAISQTLMQMIFLDIIVSEWVNRFRVALSDIQ